MFIKMKKNIGIMCMYIQQKHKNIHGNDKHQVQNIGTL